MKILITGANGFIGSNLAERLLRDGHEVRGLVRKNSDLSFLNGLAIEPVFGDITDPAAVDTAVKGMNIVIHVAGLASDWGPYDAFYKVNVLGTRNVMEACSKHSIVRLVHISTTALHGFPGFQNATEETPLAKTIWPYCETKKLAELELKEYAQKTGLDTVIIRPGNVFGSKDHTFFEKYADALRQRMLGYVSGGTCLTCPTYIENLTDAVTRACFMKNISGQTFIITDGLEITWKAFTEKIADVLGYPRPIYSLPFRLGYGLAIVVEALYRSLGIRSAPFITRYRICNGGRNYHFSIEKARRLLGYEPAVTLDEAIRRTAAWYQKKTNPGKVQS